MRPSVALTLISHISIMNLFINGEAGGSPAQYRCCMRRAESYMPLVLIIRVGKVLLRIEAQVRISVDDIDTTSIASLSFIY